MQAPELTESFLAKTAGWEAMKHARALVAADRVLSSSWKAPMLQGVVQEGSASYRAGLVIRGSFDIENLCTCRASSQWGTICAHSVAVGLHFLKAPAKPITAGEPSSRAPATSLASLWRVTGDDSGEPVELHFILPPHWASVVEKSRIALCCEAVWRGKRSPLTALPRDVPLRFSSVDMPVLERLEALAGGEPPAMLLMPTTDTETETDPRHLGWRRTLIRNPDLGGNPGTAGLEFVTTRP
jgi:hypothetical protein